MKSKIKMRKVVLIFSLVLIMLISLMNEISLTKAQDFSDTPWLYQDWTQGIYVEENPPPPSDIPSPTLGGLSVFMEETGNIGLNILWLGWYGVAQRAYMYNQGINVPQTWAQAGLQTLDATPIVGSIKAATETSGLERAGHCCSALGQGLLIGVGAYKAYAGGGCAGGGCPKRGSSPYLPIKYDPDFAIDQMVGSHRIGTIILYHHTNIGGYVDIMGSNLIWGSTKPLSGIGRLSEGFVYLTDIPKIQTAADLNSLFMRPRVLAKKMPIGQLENFRCPIKLRVPKNLVESFPSEFEIEPPASWATPWSGVGHGPSYECAPHIFRIPCAIGGRGKPYGVHIKPILEGYYYDVFESRIDAFRTPRPTPKINSLDQYWNLIYKDKYP